jgi:hypothetical protein
MLIITVSLLKVYMNNKRSYTKTLHFPTRFGTLMLHLYICGYVKPCRIICRRLKNGFVVETYFAMLSCLMSLGMFRKLRKATVSCVTSVCLSVCTHGTTGRRNFHVILYLSTYGKSVLKIKDPLKSDNKKGDFI